MANARVQPSANQCAAFSIASGGTPVIRAARQRIPWLYRFRYRVESDGVLVDEIAILEAIPQH